MKILYVSAEASPFAVSGGLGDVMGSLPRAIREVSGAAVSVMLPLYSTIDAEHRAKMKRIAEFTVPYGWRRSYVGIWQLWRDGVEYLFVDNEQYFKRPNMYGQFDDGERYAYFCHAVIEYILHSGWVPDILHANDWQTALAVVYPRVRYRMCEELHGMKTVFTVHNIEYQGRYGMDSLGDIFDIGWEDAPCVAYDGDINLLKAAAVTADAVTTVSPTYARELREPYFAYGLAPIMRMLGDGLRGILNGVDEVEFDPTDPALPAPYTRDTVNEGKALCKRALLSELSLPDMSERPLLAMVTRLTEGKGIALLLHVLDELMVEDITLVLLGSGDARYEEVLLRLAERYKDKMRVILGFDRALSKRIYAAADFFLMPSKTEPCGLSQMIACRYGTPPIVHGVGGLADSIRPPWEEGACGFVFQSYNAHDMLFRIKDALALYRDTDALTALRRAAMGRDFGWHRSALSYTALYNALINGGAAEPYTPL